MAWCQSSAHYLVRELFHFSSKKLQIVASTHLEILLSIVFVYRQPKLMVNHVIKGTKISYLLAAKFGNCWQYSFWLCSFFRMCRIEPACQIEIIFYFGFSQQLSLFEKFVKILRQWPNIYQIIFQTRWFKGCFIEFNLYSKRFDGNLCFRIYFGPFPMMDTDNVVLARQKLCNNSNAFSSASGSINPHREHLIIGEACLVMNTCGSL